MNRHLLGLAILVFAFSIPAGGCSAGQTPPAQVAAVQTAVLPSNIPTVVQETAAPTGRPNPAATPTTPQATSPPKTAQTAVILPAACQVEICQFDRLFWMDRPIGLPNNDRIDLSYPYGSTQNQTREAHHGVEFNNPTGTAVLAAADSQVQYTGQDNKTLFGAWPDFYGNLIILQHDPLPDGTPVFTLYGHLSKISVKTGDRVQSGQVIGQVGMSGSAIGSHLHFEVRLGDTLYTSTRNPLFYLRPVLDPATGRASGVLAGRVQDDIGKPWHIRLSVQYLDAAKPEQTPLIYPEIYPYDVPRDPTLQENFSLGDLAPGQYRLAFVYNNTLYSRVVEILPGQLTFINISTKVTPTP